MGGGAAMRAAAKAAGIGVLNNGIRGGFSSASAQAAEQSVRNAKRPVSAIISSSSQQNKNSGDVEIEGFQRPAFELDDWEFAGVESEEGFLVFNKEDEVNPRVVFGAPPSFEEAKAATAEVKDALEKVYNDSLYGNQFSNSETADTKSIISDAGATSAPRYAVKAFRLLNQSPEVQSVVASISMDPNVWDAVFNNEALQEYLLSQKTSPEFDDWISPRLSSVSSNDGSQVEMTENKPVDILEKIKSTMTEMMNDVSTFVQQMLGYSPLGNVSGADDANSRSLFFDKTVGASFMALAVMVIMVVVVKRG